MWRSDEQANKKRDQNGFIESLLRRPSLESTVSSLQALGSLDKSSFGTHPATSPVTRNASLKILNQAGVFFPS